MIEGAIAVAIPIFAALYYVAKKNVVFYRTTVDRFFNIVFIAFFTFSITSIVAGYHLRKLLNNHTPEEVFDYLSVFVKVLEVDGIYLVAGLSIFGLLVALRGLGKLAIKLEKN